MEVNGIRVSSCEHAAELIKASGDTRLRVIIAGSPLAAVFGVDFADMCAYAQLTRKAFLAAFCCAIVLIVLPMRTHYAHYAHDAEQIRQQLALERGSANQVQRSQANTIAQQKSSHAALGSELASTAKTLADERQKLDEERHTKEQQLTAVRMHHEHFVNATLAHINKVDDRILELWQHNETLTKEHDQAQEALRQARLEAQVQTHRLGVEKARAESEALRAERMHGDSAHHSQTVSYLRRRDTLLKQQLAAALAAINDVSAQLDATPFPPPPPPSADSSTIKDGRASPQSRGRGRRRRSR
eukprot:5227579-Prymnesium_polylepis.3